MSLVFETLGQLSDHMAGTGVQVVDPGVPIESIVAASDDLWATQPSVRKVVGFVARNVASTPLHVYERVTDTDRRRVTTGPLVETISNPDPTLTRYRFWELVLIDWLLNDRWCVAKFPDGAGGMGLRRLPIRTWRFKADGLDRVDAVKLLQGGRWVEHDPAGYIFDRGYARVGANGTSPAETLRAVLAEADEAVAYRRSVWSNGARVPAVLERPAGAPPWSETAKGRFRRSWQNFIRGGGQEGGTPILEDGMTLRKVDAFSPQDTQDLEGRKLTDVEVATAYHIAPELLGIREGTYSNVEAFRESLYRDALGPLITQWEQTINAMLTPDLAEGRDLYVEAHVDAKLRGSPMEQIRVLTSAVGAPYMLRNEGRALLNMPALDEGDELVTPLNVTVGGLANPRDTGSQNEGPRQASRQVKAMEDGLSTVSTERDALQTDLARYQDRLADAVLSGLGAKGAGPLPDAFDLEARNEELRRLLAGRSRRLAQAGADEVLASWNPGRDGWNPDVMDPWLARASESNAARINQGLYDSLAEVVTGPDWEDEAAGVLGAAGWAALWAVTIATESASFGRQDAAEASGLDTKTWRTTSGNPRPSHAALDGMTIPVDAMFAVGGRWPGDPFQPVEENAGCQCVLEYGRGDV